MPNQSGPHTSTLSAAALPKILVEMHFITLQQKYYSTLIYDGVKPRLQVHTHTFKRLIFAHLW